MIHCYINIEYRIDGHHPFKSKFIANGGPCHIKIFTRAWKLADEYNKPVRVYVSSHLYPIQYPRTPQSVRDRFIRECNAHTSNNYSSWSPLPKCDWSPS